MCDVASALDTVSKTPGQPKTFLWVQRNEWGLYKQKPFMSPEKVGFAKQHHSRYQAVVVCNCTNVACGYVGKVADHHCLASPVRLLGKRHLLWG